MAIETKMPAGQDCVVRGKVVPRQKEHFQLFFWGGEDQNYGLGSQSTRRTIASKLPLDSLSTLNLSAS